MCGALPQPQAVHMLDHVTCRLRPTGGRPFHLLLVALAASSCGDWLYNVALLALVYGRTHSPTLTAVTTAARVAPMLVLGPFSGSLVNRVDRRVLMIGSDLVRAGLMIVLAVVAVAGLPIVIAPVLAALATAAGVATPAAVAATAARLVADADRQRAAALRSGIGQAAVVVGPAAGALVLLAAGPALAIALNAATFLVSAAAIAAIPAGPVFAPAAEDAGPSSLIGDVMDGARALRSSPAAARFVAADVLCSVVYGILTVALALLGRRLGGGSGAYGLLLAGFGAGGLLGAALAAHVDAPGRWRTLLTGGLVLVSIALFGFGAIPALPAALALAVLGGGGMIVGEVLSETALPRLLDDAALARTYGLVFPAAVAGIIAGSLVAGPLISLAGLQGAFTLVGLLVLAAGALLVRRPFVHTSAAPALAA